MNIEITSKPGCLNNIHTRMLQKSFENNVNLLFARERSKTYSSSIFVQIFIPKYNINAPSRIIFRKMLF